MKEHTFVDREGERQRCLYPEGRDPLLVAWQAGDYDTHPRWNDALFLADVARRKAQEDLRVSRRMAKKNGRAS